MNQPKIGILYLTFPMAKWERDIPNAMKSLQKMTYPKEKVELICIESQGNREPVWPWFEREWMPESEKSLPRITYLNHSTEKLGFSDNNNLALEKAKELGCEYVYLLNEDAEVEPDFLEPMIARMVSDPTVAIAQSLILLGDKRDQVNTIGNAFHYLGFGYSLGYLWKKEKALEQIYADKKTNPDLEIGYASGAGMMVRVSALHGQPLFNLPFFMYHEDTDASFFQRIQGRKIVLVPESVIYHWYEFSKSISKYFWMERNRYAMLFMYLKSLTLALIFPMLIVMEIALLLFAVKNGWWSEKKKVYAEFFKTSYWQWIRERRVLIQKTRIINDRELTRLFVDQILFQEDSIKNPILEKIGNPLMRGYWKVVRCLLN